MEFLEGLLAVLFLISSIVLIVFKVKAHKAHKTKKLKRHFIKNIAVFAVVFLIIAIDIATLPGCSEANEETLPGYQSKESTLTQSELEPVQTSSTKITTTEVETTATTKDSATKTAFAENAEVAQKDISGNLTVHFIDVGQGDAILIQQGESAMLIDAGGNSNGSQVVSFIKGQGISRLEYIVGTHPHEDHVGGLDDVIKAFDIGKVIMPDIIHTTKTFEDVLAAIQGKGLKITKAVPGNNYSLGGADLEIVGPISISNSDLNNASVVCRIVYGSNSFLFAGDAESKSESQIISAGYNLSADVLKAGHHGSKTSSSDAFLSKIQPKHVVIMVGAGNTYGHPSHETLEKLTSQGISIYRTDLAGTITITSDGSSISVNKQPQAGTAPVQKETTQKSETQATTTAATIVETTAEPVQTTAPPAESNQYIGNLNTKKFHKPSCSSLPNPENQILLNSRQEAVDLGYDPCGRCKP